MEFFLRNIYPWLIQVSSISPILPFLLGLLWFARHKNWQFRLLYLHVILIVAIEVAGKVTVMLGTKNNLWLHHLYAPIEFCVLAAIYYCSFRQTAYKRGILAAAICFVLFSIVNAVFFESITQMNSIAKIVENALLIVLAVLYFYKVSNDLNIKYLDRDPIFLLSCAMLIYKAGTTMSSAMFNQALAISYDAARICIAITLVLNILYYASLIFMLKRASA
ncbi:hypothetical protein [Pontibacter ruber]|uniref:Uncharacterized protein n=1 Tax=Pontibacter ruber TaxID=1343895 RepID=A0ABW5CXG7_9BACT|nr:hypothetical protein [Pontibacter ruber]